MGLTRRMHELEYSLAERISVPLSCTSAPVAIKARRGAEAIHALIGTEGGTRRSTAALIISSLWRSNVLLKYARSVSKGELWGFLEDAVESPGRDVVAAVSEMEGAIIATPHYGPFLLLCLDLIRRFDGTRRLNIMFNDPAKTPSNRSHEDLFRSLARDVGFYYPDRKGTIAALKGLRNGEVLALMPDVYFQSASLMAVPFFGRLLRVMPGTSFFSIRSGASILPVYPYPAERFGMRLGIGDPISPISVGSGAAHLGDDCLSFALMRKYFHAFESVLAADPHHWNYWDSVLRRSTTFKPNHETHSESPTLLLSQLERLGRALALRLKQNPELEEQFSEFHFHCKARFGG